MDTVSLVALTMLATMIVVGAFATVLVRFEKSLADGFSRASQSARWFSLWLLAFPLWGIGRYVGFKFTHWYTVDVDSLVLAFLFSAVPFWLENAIKYSQAKQLTIITDLVVSVREELDHSKERDEAAALRDEATAIRDRAMFELIQRGLETIERAQAIMEENNVS